MDSEDERAGMARGQKISNIARMVTLAVSCVAAAASVSTWAGKAVFSVHDLEQNFSEFGRKLDDITARMTRNEQDTREYDDYTDRRFDWLNARVSNLEGRADMAAPPHRSLQPKP